MPDPKIAIPAVRGNPLPLPSDLEREVAELRAQNERLWAALAGLVERDASYHCSEIRIACDSHGDAIARMAAGRAALETKP